ncbi:hypothetical protein V493_03591 [Pseudogymnoascus sp. VKM F-4281 (FW-2241)]|nr:hypothetical protein V493_03591 [Pseudogymnoascus sp. VKM F-4281 (FW-2241)]
MQLQTVFITLAASMASLSYAAPNPSTEFVSLWNGEKVTVNPIESRSVLEARNPCSGSSSCSNSQGFKNACGVAADRVDAGITYKNGGDKSGVCDGHCGLFVQGSFTDHRGNKIQCTASGVQLTDAVSQIHSQDCQTCGWVTTGQNDACKIKFDYVGSC